MRRLGHPWHQTTVVKTEAAGRPLRVNEVMDLAAVLGVTVWELMGPPQYPFPALRQLIRAEEDVARLQRQLDEQRMEVDLTVQNLQHAQILVTDARKQLVEMGAVEVDGIWQFPAEDGERGSAKDDRG
jgi:hypothetical protein